MSKSDITAEELQKILQYDKETGMLKWAIRPSRAVKVGDVAGNINAKGYSTIGIHGNVYKTHRIVWFYVTGAWPIGLIDHVNGDKSDNRFVNLRDVGADGNSQNVRKPNKRNKSGFMGVIFYQNKWRASITVNKKTIRIGDYATPEEAHQAYLVAKRISHAACTI
jgi:HNH endonuclease/AP2 domain